MGQMLDRPITRKNSTSAPASGGLQLSWAASDMQGWRIGMEDAHICLPALPASGCWGAVGLFGVLDGHGGEQVAKFSARHLPEELCRCPLEKQSATNDLRAALIGSFHRMDELLRDGANRPELQSLTNKPAPEAAGKLAGGPRSVDVDMVGCTACLCCVTEDEFVVANAGDSRAVLCRGGRAIALSQDHKPNDPREKQRIEAAGGYVENSAPGQYRVNGNLNLSRALGDLEYKKDVTRKPEQQIICSTPDVDFYKRTEDDEFLVICCDGVWDVKTNQEVVDFIRDGLQGSSQDDPHSMVRVLESLLDACVSPDLRLTRGLGGDNMTAVLVLLPAGRPAVEPPASPADATAAKSLHLIRARRKSATAEAPGGALSLRLGLPAGCALRDVGLRVSEPTAKLEVSVAAASEGSLVKTFDLEEHLPPGAELSIPAKPPQLAKLFTKTDTLKVSLPIRMLG